MPSEFQLELLRYGPDASYATPSLVQARGYCARLARRHYENFTVASVLLPRRLLPHFYAIYAYCRWADDLGDETGGGSQALALLRWWRQQLLDCYDGKAVHPVMVALAATIRQFQIPGGPFLDLLFAFEQDQLVKRYRNYDQLLAYCRYSANPVGRLVLFLCRCFSEENAAFSDQVCTALQLANFWQDVARDFDIGRVYLPEEDRLHFGYHEDDLQARRSTPGFLQLMQFEVDRTREMFYRGWPLIDRVPLEIRSDIELFIQGGLGILGKIEKIGYRVWDQRPVLSGREKLSLLGGVFWRRLRSALFSAHARTSASMAIPHANGSAPLP